MREKFNRILAQRGASIAQFEDYEPWFVNLSLMLGLSQQMGFRPDQGLDNYLMQQAATAQGLPRLDPRTPITFIRNTGSIRDLLRTISDMTGIGVTYEQQTQSQVDRPFPFEIRNVI